MYIGNESSGHESVVPHLVSSIQRNTDQIRLNDGRLTGTATEGWKNLQNKGVTQTESCACPQRDCYCARGRYVRTSSLAAQLRLKPAEPSVLAPPHAKLRPAHLFGPAAVELVQQIPLLPAIQNSMTANEIVVA